MKIITDTVSYIYQHLREIVETFTTTDSSTNCFAVYYTIHGGNVRGEGGGGGGGGGEDEREGDPVHPADRPLTAAG